MHRLLTALIILCSLTLVGCGFIDDDLHLSDDELNGGVGGMGIGGVGMSGGCGCGRFGSRHLRRLHARGTRAHGTSEIYLGESHIYGRVAGEEGVEALSERREAAQNLPATPVETVAEHAEDSRREAIEEFMR